ncbi:MAG TPA: PDZ domain-containing protein, partial [Planctomycetota bacterium]|nr:PDZ domain-containing protein [Planctomycetota bacterium]
DTGIDYAGSRVLFKRQAAPDFGFRPFNAPLPPPRVPPAPVPPAPEGRPIAGALLEPVDESVRSQLDLPDGQGAVVTRVLAGGIAEALGLRKSDILLEVDGKTIDSPEAAKGLITRDSKLTVLRKGKKETLGSRRDF